jgi:two-component system, chemotaxis family, response regulator Rcp1
MHLLLVEDNPADVRLVREALAPELAQGTLQFSIVRDGADALAFLHGHAPYTQGAPPDLILLDLNLPGISGAEVLAELKEDPQLHFVPTVVLTSSARRQDIDQCYQLGASAFLVKPIALEPFLRMVQLTVAFWSTSEFRTPRD